MKMSIFAAIISALALLVFSACGTTGAVAEEPVAVEVVVEAEAEVYAYAYDDAYAYAYYVE